MRSVRLVLLLLTLLAAFGPRPQDVARAEDVCALCAGTRSVTCPTCGGKGVALNPCAACGGEGRGRCDKRPRTTGKLSAEEIELLGLHKGATRRCPGSCTKGRLGDVACKLCSGAGTTKCPICAETCPVCAGKKTVEGPCVDCDGRGKLPCLACAPADGPCPDCKGTKRTSCGACKGAGHVLDFCAACGGRGREVCALCDGLGKSNCDGCLGFGKTSTGKCPMCDGKAVVVCKACRQGWNECQACGGAKRIDATCRRCGGTRETACPTCAKSSSRVAELVGVAASKAGAKDAAVALLARADEETSKRASKADAAAGAAYEAYCSKSLDPLKDDAAKHLEEVFGAAFKYLDAAAAALDARDVAKRVHAELATAKAAAPSAGK